MFFKKLLLTLIFILLVPLSFSPAALAAPKGSGVQVFAAIGWEGRVVPGKNAPAAVRLKNNTAHNLNGTVEVVNYYQHIPPLPPGSPPGAKPAGPTKYYPVSSFGEHLFLPAGGEKKVIFWFPLEGTANYVTVRFRTEKEVVASVKVKFSTFAVNQPLPLAVAGFGKGASDHAGRRSPGPAYHKINPGTFSGCGRGTGCFWGYSAYGGSRAKLNGRAAPGISRLDCYGRGTFNAGRGIRNKQNLNGSSP